MRGHADAAIVPLRIAPRIYSGERRTILIGHSYRRTFRIVPERAFDASSVIMIDACGISLCSVKVPIDSKAARMIEIIALD